MLYINSSKHVSCYILLLQTKYYICCYYNCNLFRKPNSFSTYIYTDLLWIVRFAASSTTAEDTSGPTDALRSTETAGTGTPTTSGDVTATLESTSGGK